MKRLLLVSAMASVVLSSAGPQSSRAAELLIQQGHTGATQRVAFSPDGTLLATAGVRSPEVRLWQVATGRLVRVLAGSGQGVQAVAFNREGNLLAAATAGPVDDPAGIDSLGIEPGPVIVWEVDSGVARTTLQAPANTVESVTFGQDGRTLLGFCRAPLAGADSGDFIEWDLAQGRDGQVRTIHASVSALAVHPDGRQFATAVGGRQRELGMGGFGAGPGFSTGNVGDNGSEALVPSEPPPVPQQPERSRLTLWRSAGTTAWTADAGREQVTSLTFSGDGSRLASCCDSGRIQVWDAVSGRAIRSVAVPVSGMARAGCCLALAHDGQRLATESGDALRIWDLRSGRVTVRILYEFALDSLSDGSASVLSIPSVGSVSFQPSSRWIAVAKRGSYRMFDVDTGLEVTKCPKPPTLVASLAVAADGRTLVVSRLSGTNDDHEGHLEFWDLAAGRLGRIVAPFPREQGVTGASRVSFVPHSGRLAIGSETTGEVRAVEAADGKCLYTLPHQSEGQDERLSIRALACSSDGRVVATVAHRPFADEAFGGMGSGMGRLGGDSVPDELKGDADTQLGDVERTIRLWDAATGRLLRTLEGHTASVQAVAFAPDGKTLASGDGERRGFGGFGAPLGRFGGGDGAMGFGDPEVPLPTEEVPSAEPLLAELAAPSPPRDSSVRLWDTSTGQLIRIVQQHDRRIVRVAFGAAGKILATADDKGTITQLNPATAEVLATLVGAASPALAFSADGQRLAYAGPDHALMLWDAATRQPGVRWRHPPGEVRELLWGSAGLLISSFHDGTIRVWRTDGKQTGPAATLMSFADGTWAVFDAEGRYDAANPADVPGLHGVEGTQLVALKDLQARYYDPGLLAKVCEFSTAPRRTLPAEPSPTSKRQ